MSWQNMIVDMVRGKRLPGYLQNPEDEEEMMPSSSSGGGVVGGLLGSVGAPPPTATTAPVTPPQPTYMPEGDEEEEDEEQVKINRGMANYSIPAPARQEETLEGNAGKLAGVGIGSLLKMFI